MDIFKDLEDDTRPIKVIPMDIDLYLLKYDKKEYKEFNFDCYNGSYKRYIKYVYNMYYNGEYKNYKNDIPFISEKYLKLMNMERTNIFFKIIYYDGSDIFFELFKQGDTYWICKTIDIKRILNNIWSIDCILYRVLEF